MVFTIGRRDEEGDVVDLLLACHARIRRFIDLAQRAGDDAEVRATVIRYFTEALPLHVADEEELIAPRVATGEMHAEHVSHEPLLARLCAGDFTVAPELAVLFDQHLAAEERDVFPAVRGLPQPEQDAIRAAMRARRG